MIDFRLAVSVTDIEFPHELMHQLRVSGWSAPVDMRVRYAYLVASGPRYSVEFDIRRSVEADAVAALENDTEQLFVACKKLKDHIALDMTLHKQVVVAPAGEDRPQNGNWTVHTALSLSHPVEYFLYRIPHALPTREDRIEHARKILRMIALRAFLVDRGDDYDEIGIVSPAELASSVGALSDRMLGQFKVQSN